MKIRKKPLIAVAVVLIVAFAAYVMFFARNNPLTLQSHHSLLTGVEVSQEDSEVPILGIMVENSLPARPQTGLGSAGIVFETTTEGGITRFLALYQEDMPETVAPVRSLRPAFLDWAMGFDASIAHVGGSPRALELVDDRNAKSLNQFDFEEPYFRTDNRDAPHNMSVRTASLRELQAALDHNDSDVEYFPRHETRESANEGKNATTININYSSYVFAVEYRYDSEEEKYLRYLAGKPHIDALTNEQIAVENVAVISLAGKSGGGTGTGEVTMFNRGEVIEGSWRQDAANDRIEFLDERGSPILLATGKTWIAAIPASGEMTYQE